MKRPSWAVLCHSFKDGYARIGERKAIRKRVPGKGSEEICILHYHEDIVVRPLTVFRQLARPVLAQAEKRQDLESVRLNIIQCIAYQQIQA